MAALTTFPPALAMKSAEATVSGMPSATPSVRAAATCVCGGGDVAAGGRPVAGGRVDVRGDVGAAGRPWSRRR